MESWSLAAAAGSPSVRRRRKGWVQEACEHEVKNEKRHRVWSLPLQHGVPEQVGGRVRADGVRLSGHIGATTASHSGNEGSGR